MELLGWLNARSLVTQSAAAAAGLSSIDDGKESKSAAAANFASPSLQTTSQDFRRKTAVARLLRMEQLD